MSSSSFIDDIPLQPTPYIDKNRIEVFSNTVVPIMTRSCKNLRNESLTQLHHTIALTMDVKLLTIRMMSEASVTLI